jgi:hypothetical protein
MEIIIRTESVETTAQAPSAKPYTEQAAAPTASAVELSATIDAINAGPAPTSPEQSGGPPVYVVASEYLHAERDSALSAGPAPDIP